MAWLRLIVLSCIVFNLSGCLVANILLKHQREYTQEIRELNWSIKDLDDKHSSPRYYNASPAAVAVLKEYDSEDYDQAYKNALPLAQSGDPVAQALIGEMYSDGNGRNKDNYRAFEWAMKSARQLAPQGQFMLGLFYRKGLGTPRDYASAIKYYELASAQGDYRAQNNLGNMYFNGDGVEKDKRKAFELYQKAAINGSISARTNLADMYYEGDGVVINRNAAAKWYFSAAPYDRDARGMLEDMYTSKKFTPSPDWFMKMAKQGNTKAYYNLGVLSELGINTPEDPVEAYKWFVLANSKKRIERLERELNTQQILDGQRRAKVWQENLVKK